MSELPDETGFEHLRAEAEKPYNDRGEIYYRRAQSGDHIWGGMGGGVVEDELWIGCICPKKAELARRVINAELTSIN